MNPVFEALARAANAGETVALGIISRVSGSSPQKAGAKAVFYGDGRIVGTLGGGCLEAEIQQRAVKALRGGGGERFDLLLDHDFGWDDGLICGGKVQGVIVPHAQAVGELFWNALATRERTLCWGVAPDFRVALLDVPAQGTEEWLYTETVRPPCCLWIAGAGHIAQAVTPLALQLDFEVTVFDDRPALVNYASFPAKTSLRSDPWEQLLRASLPGRPTFGLIVTRGHRHDAVVLREWIHKPFRFLGMIGSARKARTIFEHFRAENLATPDELSKVSCPVGVKIRCRSVMEIAISIMAQYIDKRAELTQESEAAAPQAC
jgi:xanthine dehydrogenase accessory factor